MSEPRPTQPALPGGFSRRFVVLAIAIALFGGSLLLYAPSVSFGFIGYDEGAVLLAHPNLYNQDSLAASAREILVGYFPREEPLIARDLTWLVDARLFGFERPIGYHLGNVLWNAVDVVLLFLFLLHARRSLAFAGITGALFAVLAIHVEPVCWVMGRKDLLGAFFTLLALLLQSIELRHKSRGGRWALAVLIFLLCPLAILSKFSAVVLFLILAVHRLYAPFLEGTRRRSEALDLRSRWRELAVYLPHFLVSVGLYVWYQHSLSAFQVIGGRGPSPLSLQHLKTLALLVPLSLGRTLGHFFSAGQHSMSYLRPNVGLPLTGGDIAIIVAMVLGSALLVWTALRRRKDLAFFVLAFFVFMLPYFNVEYIGIWVADRYAYLSSLCVVALLVAFVLDAWPAHRRAAAALSGLLVLLGGYNLFAGQRHQGAFHDARAFWDYEVTRSQPSMLAFESYTKTALAEAAAAEPGTPERASAIERLSQVAGKGLTYYRSLPWNSASGYFSREKAHAAGLYTSLGLAASLAGSPPEQRLLYHRLAYQMMPSQHTALMLAQVLLDMARRAPPSEPLARESLRYFGLYLREAKSDPLRRRGLPDLLHQYTDVFPALASEANRVAAEALR